MVGYDPSQGPKEDAKKSRSRETMDRVAAGALSGFITRLLFQPLDVVKIRFQLQLEPIDASSARSKYKGFTQTLSTIAKEEGVTALWKGHVPAQYLSIIYGSFQFSSFYFFTRKWSELIGYKESSQPLVHFVCGSWAGCCGTIASHPLDVMRTRLVGQGEPKIYNSFTTGFIRLARNEGLLGLYRGLLPNIVLVAPQTGAAFFANKVCKQMWVKAMPSASSSVPSWAQSLTCGGVAGIFSKTLIYPLDFVKKRLEIQGFEKARKHFGSTARYTGSIDCLVKVVKNEGFKGLYKGLFPGLLKAMVTTAAHFTFYEQLLALM